MVIPIAGTGAEVGGPAGHTYAAVLIRVAAAPGTQARVPVLLRELRFTGWLARRPQDGWLVAVAGPADRAVAAGGRGVAGVGERLAERLAVPVLAVQVRRDRQLSLVAWADGDEAGRYVSDPAAEPDADAEVLSEPIGAGDAAGFAAACGRPESADDLAEVLAEELDPDSVIESERLARVLRLLGLPTWLVAAATLPHDIPTGPGRRDLIRLGAGLPGVSGWFAARAAGLLRRRPPPPVVADPPRGRSGPDPWLF